MAPQGQATGAFTFLFTDIEGSTRTWEHAPEFMEGWLANHDRLLGEAIATNGGRVFKHTGDGLCAVFGSARAAAQAAREVQRAVAAADEETLGGLRVRIAVHTGEAIDRDGDFYGPTLNRCARLLDTAYGGQVLLSGSTVALLSAPSTVGEDVTLVDLGNHRLRDLQQPLRVWQLAAPELEGGFPPLRSLDAFLHNLPEQRSSFVGRETEAAALQQRLAAHRLVTVAGVGGCGKTRLALTVAVTQLELFADGVFFVDLSILLEPSLVGSTIAAALRIPAGSGKTDDRILDFLSDRHVLIVLDNCEHLLEAAAEIVDRLLANCPAVHILATSREPLALDGEQVWRVPSLKLPANDVFEEIAAAEAVKLFVDRAAAVRPGFTLRADNATSVVEICRRLDGIPLAIELAAARVAHLAPAEIAARLADRFRLLTAGRRGVQRQQTLQAVLDWSHELLTEAERTLLRRLCVFAGGFTLEAAQGVCAVEGVAAEDVMDLLGSLVARSLVNAEDRSDHTRYRLLETVRLYAQDRLLGAGEVDALRTRHASWFVEMVETHGTPGFWFGITTPQLLPELDNLRMAADWSRASGRHDLMLMIASGAFNEFQFSGRTDEVDEWIQDAVGHEAELSPSLRARCHSAWAGVAEMRGEFLLANERARVAVALAEDPADAGGAYSMLIGNLTWFDADEVERLLKTADEWTRHLRTRARHFIWASLGGLALARRDYDEAAALLDRIPADGSRQPVHLSAAAHLLRGDPESARVALERNVPQQLAGWPEYLIPYLRSLIAAADGDLAGARTLLSEAATVVRRWKIPLGIADCVVACAAIAFHAGDVPRAGELLASVHAATGGALRSTMSMAIYRHYVAEVRAQLDPETRQRVRAAGAALSLEDAIAREL